MSTDIEASAEAPQQGEGGAQPPEGQEKAAAGVDPGAAQADEFEHGSDDGTGLYGDAEADDTEQSDADGDGAAFVPESPDGYELPEVEGVEWGDRDQPALQSLFSAVHETGMNQAQVNALGQWYHTHLAEIRSAEREADGANRKIVRNAIVETRGADGFKAEMGKVKTHLAAMPHGLGDDIRKARLPNGRLLSEDIRFIHFFAHLERGGASDPSTVEAREAELKKMMRDDPIQYQKTGLKDLAELRAKKAPQVRAPQNLPPLTQAEQNRLKELRAMMRDDRREYERTGREEFGRLLASQEANGRR